MMDEDLRQALDETSKDVSELEGARTHLDATLADQRQLACAVRDRLAPLLSQERDMAEGALLEAVDPRSEHVRALSRLAVYAEETSEILREVLARLDV